MRLRLTIIFTLIISSIYGQSNVSFVFYDACNQDVVHLPYLINDYRSNTSLKVENGKPVQLKEGSYQVEVEMIQDEMLTTFWFDITVTNKPLDDTLFLQKARFYGPIVLHPDPEEFKHLCCGNLCDGIIEDADLNGTVRFKGRFKGGKPISNLKYYNSNGKLVRTEKYVNGRLKRIK